MDKKKSGKIMLPKSRHPNLRHGYDFLYIITWWIINKFEQYAWSMLPQSTRILQRAIDALFEKKRFQNNKTKVTKNTKRQTQMCGETLLFTPTDEPLTKSSRL